MSIPRSWCLALLLLTVKPAQALEWGLGAHLGVVSMHGDNAAQGSSTVVAWPSSPLAYQPALRIACSDHRRGNELFLDSGQFLIDEAGSELHMLVVFVGYQRVLASRRASSLFLNADLGQYREGSATHSVSSTAYGAGVGARRVLKAEQGALRAEVRVDWLGAAGSVGRPRLTTIGLRLGFDLWL